MTKTINELMDELKEALDWPPRTTVKTLEDESRVFTHGAQPMGGIFSDRNARINEMREWCNEVFGPKPYGEYYGDRWTVSNGTFWFKNEDDRMMFVLRWS